MGVKKGHLIGIFLFFMLIFIANSDISPIVFTVNDTTLLVYNASGYPDNIRGHLT